MERFSVYENSLELDIETMKIDKFFIDKKLLTKPTWILNNVYMQQSSFSIIEHPTVAYIVLDFVCRGY